MENYTISDQGNNPVKRGDIVCFTMLGDYRNQWPLLYLKGEKQYKVVDTEVLCGVECLKLEGLHQFFPSELFKKEI